MYRYADQLMDWLVEFGYSHCFFLAGGNSMHLVNAASKRFSCIPFIHEVSATIASEYFNEASIDSSRSFVLVTAGPGLTNSITGIAGAWLESRELLIIGGQVKSSDLATGGLRQRGIQEIDGMTLVKSITKASLRIETPLHKSAIKNVIDLGRSGRRGPVFIEVCIDASAKPSDCLLDDLEPTDLKVSVTIEDYELSPSLVNIIEQSNRPLLLLGNGVSRESISQYESIFRRAGLPIASTWSGADRSNADYPYYAGRPNTYGMRWANVFQQQSDLLIAVGTRLNLQQTGFNWQEFMPVGKVIHVDIDENELNKENPSVDVKLPVDSSRFLKALAEYLELGRTKDRWEPWLEFLEIVRHELPIVEDAHSATDKYVEPYHFINEISRYTEARDIIIPCSSGGTFTCVHQSYINVKQQQIISNKGLASMGYGLAGAIGASLANRERRVVLFEGDGGFAQNLQELGTVFKNALNLKMFVVDNEGYASIRSSQISYFQGNYVGCDIKTGLGMPDWKSICDAFSIAFFTIDPSDPFSKEFLESFREEKPTFYLVKTDPAQMYLPKVSSKINPDGSMTSAAIHDMSPKLDREKMLKVFKYLPEYLWGEDL
jgi:acetolactate synthase-1/2/3 large subunit